MSIKSIKYFILYKTNSNVIKSYMHGIHLKQINLSSKLSDSFIE